MRSFALIIVLLFIIGAFFVLNDRAPGPNVDIDAGLSEGRGKYFEDQMIERAVADIGQPIEGFDAELLIRAYPGLSQQDFADVSTREGRYEISPSDELQFVRDESKMISSAERMISAEGYGTLLANLAFRLDMATTTEEDIDAIIDRIDTGEQLEARIEEAGEALGIRIIPHEVLEDSRCPLDVACVQAGTVRVRTTVESGAGPASQTFVLEEPVSVGERMVTLVNVTPEPESSSTIEDDDYLFMFAVTR